MTPTYCSSRRSDGGAGLEVAGRLADQGIGSTVVDPRWVLPVDPAMPASRRRHRLVVTIEDHGRQGGAGSTTAMAMRDAVSRRRCSAVDPAGVSAAGTARRGARRDGLTAQDIARQVVERVAGLTAVDQPQTVTD